MTEALETVLRNARAKIADPARWCRWHRDRFAVDAQGQGVESWSRAAVAWTPYGAVNAVTSAAGGITRQARAALDREARDLGFTQAEDLSLKTDHCTVMTMFDGAIAAAMEMEANARREEA